MSKLAHSDQATMDELDRQRAIENGDEDLLSEGHTMTDRSFSYYVVALDYGKRGIEAIVDPEITRRDVIACIRSGEYKNISFIHHITMNDVPEDVTAELISAAEQAILEEV